MSRKMSRPSYEERKKIVQEQFGDFPMRIVFYLEFSHDTKEYSLSFYKTKKQNIKLENFKLDSLRKISFRNVVSTPLRVFDFQNFSELDETLDRYDKLWIEGD